MSREEYIQTNILKLLHQWTNIATSVGALAIVSLSLLDYFVTPANFKTFLLYRIATGIAIYGTYLFNRQKIDKNRHHVVMILASVIVAAMVTSHHRKIRRS